MNVIEVNLVGSMLINEISYVIRNFEDFARFWGQLSKLHGLAECLSDSDSRFGWNKSMTMVSQVSSNNFATWGARRCH